MKAYFVDVESTCPVEVLVLDQGLDKSPTDSLGNTVYSNTHWPTEAEAWRELVRRLELAEGSALSDVRHREENLVAAKDRLIAASARAVEARAKRAATFVATWKPRGEP